MCVTTKRNQARGKTLPNIVSLLARGGAAEADGEDDGTQNETETTTANVDSSSKMAAAAAVVDEIEDDISACWKTMPLPLPAVVSTSTLSLAAATASAASPITAADPRRPLPPCSKPKRAISHPKHQKHSAADSSSRRHPKHDVPHVDHTYHEHMNDEAPSQKTKIITRGGVLHPFPVKLHFLLDQIQLDGKEDVIGWMEHGRSFMVHKPREFVESVMPEYFKQTKFASFQRQLNLYGFKRITCGEDRNAYYHELFLRGKPYLGYKIMRLRVKGTGVRMASSPETEPNFYKMQYVGIKYKPVRVNEVDGTIEKFVSFDPMVQMEKDAKPSTKGDYKMDQPDDTDGPVKEGKVERGTNGNEIKAGATSPDDPDASAPPEASTPPPILERSSPLPSPTISPPRSPPYSEGPGVIVDRTSIETVKEDCILPPVAQLEKPVNIERSIPHKKRRSAGYRSSRNYPRKRMKDERCINPVTMMRINPTVAATLSVPATEILPSTPYLDTGSVEEFQSTISPIEENTPATINSDDNIDEVQFCGCSFHYMAHLDRQQLNDIEAAGPPSPHPPSMDIPFPNFKPPTKNITPSSSWEGPLCSRCSPRPLPPPTLLSAPYFPLIEKPILQKSLSTIVSDDDDEGKGKMHKQIYVEPKRSSEDEMNHFFESLGLPYDYLEDVEKHEMLDTDEKLGVALENMLEHC